MSNLCADLVSGKNSTSSILITSETVYLGRLFLETLIRQRLQREWDVHYVTFDVPAEKLLIQLPSSKVRIYDCFGEPPMYVIKMAKANLCKENLMFSELVGNVRQKKVGPDELQCPELLFALQDGGSPKLIVLNALNSVLLHFTTMFACKLLKKYSQLASVTHQLQMVSLFVEEGQASIQKNILRRYHQTVISLIPSETQNMFTCKVRHKKPKGKFMQQPEVRQDSEAFIKSDPLHAIGSLSFRLQLSEREKEDRDQLILPHLRKQTQSGCIVYEFEEQDDWDPEDPDDDLDI